MSKKTIAVIGGGRWARAIAQVIAGNEAEVARVVVHHPQRQGDLAALGDADILILATPAHAVRGILAEAGAVMHGGHYLVHAVGSLEPTTLKRISEVIAEETPVRRVGALAGPALALDLEEARPAALVCGSRFDEVGALMTRVLSSRALRAYASPDLIGVELARAMVAAVALAGGVGQALDLGPAAQAVLVTRGAAEIARLGVALGGSERTFFGLAGLGELLVATQGRGSADFELGMLLGRGEKLADAERKVGRVCDGPTMVREAFRLGQMHRVRMTLISALHHWLGGERTVKEALSDMFQSGTRTE